MVEKLFKSLFLFIYFILYVYVEIVFPKNSVYYSDEIKACNHLFILFKMHPIVIASSFLDYLHNPTLFPSIFFPILLLF